MLETNDTGIYIHFPFCVKKCFYCDFYSVADLNLTGKFIDYLKKEMSLYFDSVKSEPLPASSLFIGGGTPSLLTPEQLNDIITHLKKYIRLAPHAEITVESNPGTHINQYLNEYRTVGINRLSIGVQSFNDDELIFLQRIHNAEEAAVTIRKARQAVFDNINIDLIFSLPGQTADKLMKSIDKAMECSVDHISVYSLIYEEGTPLHNSWSNKMVKKNSDELESELYFFLIDELNKNGFEQYEVSNFARPGKKCFHNLNYWRSGSYISFGPSAHSYMNGIRYANVKDIHEYFTMLDRGIMPVSFRETLGEREIMVERVFLSLRAEGLHIDALNRDYCIDLENLCRYELSQYLAMGLISLTGGVLKLLPRGYAVCDSICLKIIEKIEQTMHKTVK